MATRETRREAFLRWGSFVVASTALVLTFLKGPVLWSLRTTIQEQLRNELARYESLSSVRRDRANVLGEDLVKRFDHDLAVLQDMATVAQTNRGLILDLTRRLSVVETNLEALRQQIRTNQEPQQIPKY